MGCCSEPQKRYAIGLCVLSALVLVTGNPFLGFVGIICGGMSLSPDTIRRSPDLIAMLLGAYLITANPERTCAYSKTVVKRFESYSTPYLGSTVAPGQEQVLGYPLNMTETA